MCYWRKSELIELEKIRALLWLLEDMDTIDRDNKLGYSWGYLVVLLLFKSSRRWWVWVSGGATCSDPPVICLPSDACSWYSLKGAHTSLKQNHYNFILKMIFIPYALTTISTHLLPLSVVWCFIGLLVNVTWVFSLNGPISPLQVTTVKLVMRSNLNLSNLLLAVYLL